MKLPKRKRSPLEDLLGTADADEQAKRVHALMQPILILAIHFDARTGQIGVSPIGPPVPVPQAYRMLEGARLALLEQERKQAQQPPEPAAPTSAPQENT